MKTSIKTIMLLASLAVGLTSPLFSEAPELTKGTQSMDRQLAATPPQLKPPLHGLEEVGWQDERKPPFPRPPVFAAYFAGATKAKKASSFAEASTVAGGYGGQDGGRDDRQAGPLMSFLNGLHPKSNSLAINRE